MPYKSPFLSACAACIYPHQPDMTGQGIRCPYQQRDCISRWEPIAIFIGTSSSLTPTAERGPIRPLGETRPNECRVSWWKPCMSPAICEGLLDPLVKSIIFQGGYALLSLLTMMPDSRNFTVPYNPPSRFRNPDQRESVSILTFLWISHTSSACQSNARNKETWLLIFPDVSTQDFPLVTGPGQ